MSTDTTPTRDQLLDALRAVREALDIPHAATMGDQEKRDAIFHDRAGHAVVMLRALLAENSWSDWSWSTEYLRERIAELPPTGYKTWDERVVELEAAKAAAR